MFLFARRSAWRFARDFGRDVALLNAYNQRRLGLRAVPLAAITGTVGRTDLCNPERFAEWRDTPRFRGMLRAMGAGAPLPPVDLYLLDGHYYVRDGHHRIAAAARLGLLDLDAEVTECLPTAGAPVAWHRARAAFEQETRLTGLHVRQAAGYALLRDQIAEHAWYLGERRAAGPSVADAAAHWAREVYGPVVAALAHHGVLDRRPDLTATELYLAVCDHKWYRSEQLARDLGFAAAVREYARLHQPRWLRRLAGWPDRDWLAVLVTLVHRVLGAGESVATGP
jgi:hypothetical protein